MVRPRTVEEEEEIYEELGKYLWNITDYTIRKEMKKDTTAELYREYMETKNEELVYHIYKWKQITGRELQRSIRMFLKPASDHRTIKRHIQNLQDRDIINSLDKKKILVNSKKWEINDPILYYCRDKDALEYLKEVNSSFENR
jgi:predicted HTH transcriptional regulator